MNKISSLLFMSSLPCLTLGKGLRSTQAKNDQLLEDVVLQSNQSYSEARALNTGAVSILQVGNDIEGENYYDFSGTSISISANGKSVVVGANGASGTRGDVRTFTYDDISQSWLQQGQTLVGEGGGDESGTSVSMSHDGMRIAVGAPQNNNFKGHARAFQFSASSQTWIQLGQDIDGDAALGGSGYAVALSGDGNRLAIGSPEDSTLTGSVKVFEIVSDTWAQLGAAIVGNDYYSSMGSSVALSDSGSRVVVGSRFDKENGESFVGAVSVFEYVSNDWARLGNELSGEAYFDHFGDSVDISGDGSRIVVGAPNKEDGDLVNVGSTEVYEYDATNGWLLVGNAIKGRIAFEQLGTSVSMSRDGNRIVVGSEFSDENGTDSGKTWVFQYDPLVNDWSQLGVNIFGDAYDRAGQAVAISADGDHFAIGAPLNDYYTGETKVFEIMNDGNGGCASSERLLRIEVTTDANGAEDNHFRVWTYDEDTGIFSNKIWEQLELQSSTTEVFYKCLPVDGCYRVVMLDRAGDGMCCENGEGKYQVMWDGDVIHDAKNFKEGKRRKSDPFGGSCVPN